MKKRFTALLLVLAACCSLMIPIHAADAPRDAALSVDSLSAEEIRFFEGLGIDFEKVTAMSYSDAMLTAQSGTARSASRSSVDVLQFDMRDGDTASSTAILFTDDAGNPVSAQAVVDKGIKASGDTQNYMGVTAQYRLLTDGFWEVYINPCSITIWTSTNCTDVSASYFARGNRCSFASGSPVVMQLDTEARIANSYATVLANRSYTTTGSYSYGCAIPYNEAILIAGFGNETHGAAATYTTAAGVFYNAGFAFHVDNT